MHQMTVFSLDCLDMGGFIPPYERQVHGDKALMGGGGGGTHEGRHRPYVGAGPNFDRLCHKLKVLLLLLILL